MVILDWEFSLGRRTKLSSCKMSNVPMFMHQIYQGNKKRLGDFGEIMKAKLLWFETFHEKDNNNKNSNRYNDFFISYIANEPHRMNFLINKTPMAAMKINSHLLFQGTKIQVKWPWIMEICWAVRGPKFYLTDEIFSALSQKTSQNTFSNLFVSL